MMRFGYGFDGAGVGDGWGIFGSIVCLIIVIDLILAGIWLWKQIKK
ncbi:MAG: hypothetical protein UX71_C0005G0068 [Parcubacteria group bacterium GW2011_GWA1_47_10]|nr:MAG: hypothetical protein UX71_C0005G0068 [Parcubacteria group bacterium GW2011_GWA1_47_10]